MHFPKTPAEAAVQSALMAAKFRDLAQAKPHLAGGLNAMAEECSAKAREHLADILNGVTRYSGAAK